MNPPPPTVDPFDRGDVPPEASSYRRGDQVWVWQHGQGWLPGTVEASGDTAVMVQFWPEGSRGTMVDSFVPVYVLPRPEGTT